MITKKINGGNFEPVVTGEIVLDAVPTEGSLNSVTSDGVAKAIAEGGGSYTAGDGIDISEGEISAKVDGTTIQVNADGELEAIGGGGGGSYTAGAGIYIDNDEISALLGNSSGGMQFDDDGIAIDWTYMENSSDGTLVAITDGVGGTSGIKVANPVPDTTGASSGDVLTIGQNGPEWAAPSGGSSGLEYYDRIEQKSLDDSMASIALGPSLARDHQSGTFNQRALVCTTTNRINVVGRGYTDNIFLMNFIANGYIRLSRSGLTSTSPTYAIWFPCTASDNRLTPIDTSIYLKTKTTYDWTSTSYLHYVYTSTGDSLTWSSARDAVFPTPFTINGEIDTTLFDQVGDWSSVTLSAPWMWVLGFQNSEGNFITCGAGNSESNTTLSVAYPKDYYNVKIMSDGGLAENRGAGLYVTNPLPASLGTAGQVLTVNSGATGVEWKNPSSSSDVFVVSRQDATTYADTLAAYNAGKYLYAKYMYNTMFAFFDKYVPQNSGATPEGFYFYWLDMNGNNMILNRWVLKPDNQWDTAAWEFTGSSM